MREESRVYVSGDCGYTIVELLIALSLLVAAMIPLAIVLSTSMRSTVSSQTHMHAREVAAGEIDQVKGMSFENIGINGVGLQFSEAGNNEIIGPEPGYQGLVAGPETVEAESGESFTVTREVRKNVNTTLTNDAATKSVSITVTWSGPGPGSSETLSTYIGPTDMVE